MPSVCLSLMTISKYVHFLATGWCIHTNQILVVLCMLWWPCSHVMSPVSWPSPISWHHDGPGRSTRGNSGSGPVWARANANIWLGRHLMMDIRVEGVRRTGHWGRWNANSRMIQWYNGPCHLITCPFSRTGPSPRTWLATDQLELRCLGLAHWDQRRRRILTHLQSKGLYESCSYVSVSVLLKGRKKHTMDGYKLLAVWWPMTWV